MGLETLEICNEYRASPMWAMQDGVKREIEPGKLLTPELTAELLAWDDIFQATMDDFICERRPVRDCMDIAAFNAQSERLRQKLQTALTGWTVTFWPIPPGL